MLTEAEVREFDALVREADMREVKSFVDDEVFRTDKRQNANVRPMDCLWIRKWKRRPAKNDKDEVNDTIRRTSIPGSPEETRGSLVIDSLTFVSATARKHSR